MTNPTIQNWKRFWCPRGGSYQLSSDGYLYDYESQSIRDKSEIVTLDDLNDIPCLILLGEPGIGKSTDIFEHSKFLEEKAQVAGDAFLKIDLQNYQTDQRLFDSIFQNSTFKKWEKENNCLYLFLDSLDEALININTLSTAFPFELKRFPLDRLKFRIASRTSEWPENLENELKSIWGEKNVLVYEMLPLRKRDIEEYVISNNVNSDAFIKIIEAREAQPFAIKPVTLSFLTSIYIQNDEIPKSKKELYLEGCRLLCEDTNESRISSKRVGELTSEQRMKIAGRIAALCIFTNKAAIWNGSSMGGCHESDLSKKTILGGTEFANGNNFIFGLDEINEALNTGLFSALGQERLGWSHRTYVEFLAAWYLTEHNFENSKVLSLIIHPGDMKRRIIPQLHETAAWLATFSQDIFNLLLDSDPEVLLHSDVLATESDIRASLVQSLLSKYETGELYSPSWGDFYYYKKLKHTTLGNQLRPYIVDKNKFFRPRRLAIDIAVECECQDLQDELASIALNPVELLGLRERAAHAIVKIGDKNTKLKLKSLAQGIAGNDPNDELKAFGLNAIWPDCISTSELFNLLTPHKQDNYFGSYWSFLDSSIARYLKLLDIPIALDWVTKNSEFSGYDNPFENLMDQIMELGLNNLEQTRILRPFAQAVIARIRNHQGIFSRNLTLRKSGSPHSDNIIEKDIDKRHILVLEILAMSEEASFDPRYLMFSSTSLIYREDFAWLIENYVSAEDNFQKKAIAGWLFNIFDYNNSEQVEILYELIQTDSIIKPLFSGWFGTVEIGSEQAIKYRKWYLATQEKEKTHPTLTPPLLERMKVLLEKNEQDDIDSWWKLNHAMTINEDTLMYGDEFEQDITELPGWKISDSGIRERITTGAKKYVVGGEPKNQEWVGKKNYIFRPAMAGYRALRLILHGNIQDIKELDVTIWQKWASIILAYPMRSSEKIDEQDDLLLKIAYIYAPDEIEKTLGLIIKKENRENGFLDWIIKRIKCIWDEKLEAFLLKIIKSGNLKPNLYREILSFLLTNHSYKTQEHVIRKLKSYRPDSKKDRNHYVAIAAELLLIYSTDLKWEVVWNTLLRDEKLASEVIGRLAYHRDSGSIFSSLTFNQLADLYLYLVNHFPPAGDRDDESDGEGFHEVSLREGIGNWRDSILSFMTNSGALEACAALRRLISDLPQIEIIKYRLQDAEAIMRQKTWIPLSESELLELFLKSETILIESGLHLMEAIIQSLNNLNNKLHGETPAAIYLWNELDNKKYQPKDENRLSDYVKLHLENELQQKGIIVNREVQIRRGNGVRGEITDIHVDAIKNNPDNNEYDKITIIIETKGCWNPELKTGMKTQLLDRYLKENKCRFGLYLIGWFKCNQWDPTDHRYGKTPQYSLDEAKTIFENQAISLSINDKYIKSYILDVTL